MPKTSTQKRQQPEWLIAELCAPEIRSHGTPSKSRSAGSCFDDVNIAFSSDDEVVQWWIESGANLDDLAQVLEKWPYVLDVELIRQQLFHLRALATGFMPVADSFGGGAIGKQAAAQEHLKRIAEGIVRGLLPGYSVKLTLDVPNGRPRALDHQKLLQDLKGVLGSLDFVLGKDSLPLLRKKQESQSAFTRRMTKLVQDVYQNSHLSCSVSDKPSLNGVGKPATYLEPRSLNLTIAWNIGKRATQKRNKASFKVLVLGILESHYQISARALESHLARLKATYPNDFESLSVRFPQFRCRF
ncbi:MAG: hypothetical protein MRJ68_12345 [Nitrospira sp.]|nr:hypothetical protein [Nitrospira sp.]